MKKFSIILPVHNGGDYIKECVESILNQTLNDFNLIVLDNCSSDNTVAWLQSLNDARIEIINSPVLLSIEDNWARALNCKKNEFVTLIGHDDVLLPHYLEEMNALIFKHPQASLYQSHYNFINSKGEVSGPCKPMDEVQLGHEFLSAQMANTINSMGTGYMMRSIDFDAIGGMPVNYPNLIFADYHLWVSLSLLSYKATTFKTCFNYRIHNSVSKVTNGEKYAKAFEQYVYFIADLANTNSLIKQVAERYSYDMIMYYTQSLSHRILKTPKESRQINVNEFIDKCREYLSLLAPDKTFDARNRKKIWLAEKFDSNSLTRSTFHIIKRVADSFSS